MSFLSGLFGGGDSPLPPPTILPVTPIPDADLIADKKKKSLLMARAASRGGRAESILSDDARTETLG